MYTHQPKRAALRQSGMAGLSTIGTVSRFDEHQHTKRTIFQEAAAKAGAHTGVEAA
ncbi:hypothetical protein [Paenibacillus sp. BC26]|uniref:hypothetical protein n=1 Tax=Paenibacillus sp. BC26 TaxID=1881032 RepID=UPI0015A534CD|nr:hypothetical protein [Paenibacillus sp. BC26]